MRVDEIQILAADVLLPPPDLTVSQWADQNARLSSEFAAEKGEWRTDRAPYQRAVMDAMGPSSPYETVVMMWAAQSGKTSLLGHFLGYIIDLDPGPVLLVEPREVDAEAFSKDRLAPMLRDTPCLRGKVADARSRDSNNTILHKKFLGGSITLAAANSPAGLAMRSIRYCLLDEVDRYPASAGSEGDPVNLAITRTANFWNRKVVLCSTPTTKGASRIEQAWLNSNQQSFWLPCPHCGAFQVLAWGHLVWPKDAPEKAEYRCEHCSKLIADWQKHQMLKAGEWRAARPEVTDIAGFWINGLYSPWRKWGTLAKKFLADKKSIETLREFVNTVLAEPWDDAAETTVDQAAVMARREHYRAAVPYGAVVLTAGVDVQKDRLELELVGWGRGEESWSIEYRVLPGDPSGALVWQELDTYLERRWQHETGISLPVAACAIDSGYESQAVYEFCRTRYHRRIFAVKGKGGPLPVWQRKPTAKNVRGEKPWIVGTDTAKETIYGRLRNPTPGTPGYSHFPADREEAYFEQLLGEVLVTTYAKGQPKREWRPKPGVRQEALDAPRVRRLDAAGDRAGVAAVHDHRQVHPAVRHRHVGDVARPNLVGPHNGHISQQIRVNSMLGVVPRQVRLGIDRLQSHQPHQTLRPRAADAEHLGHLSAAVAGRLQVLLVDPTHPSQILRRLTRRLVIQTRPIQPQQLALPTHAQPGKSRLDALPLEVNRVGQLFFSTTPPPFAGDRSARTARRSELLGSPPCDVGRRKTIPPRRRATAVSTGRSAWDGRRTGQPVHLSSDPHAPPPTPPWPSRPPRSVAASLPCFPPRIGPILPGIRLKVVVQFSRSTIGGSKDISIENRSGSLVHS